MKRFRYDRTSYPAAGAAGARLGNPDSAQRRLIIYGIMTEQSIGRCSWPGIVPAMFITICFIVAIMVILPDISQAAPRADEN